MIIQQNISLLLCLFIIILPHGIATNWTPMHHTTPNPCQVGLSSFNMQICFFITRKLYTANVEKSIRVLEIRGMVEKNGNQDLLASEMLKKFPTKKYTLGGVSIQILKNDANTFSVLMELLILDL